MKTRRAGPGRHVFFLLAAFAVLMAAIDSTIVAVAVPQLTSALDAPLAWVGWTLTAYQLVQVVMLPLAGKLSDTLGRKRVFLFCVGMFTFGSLLCGFAPSIGFLVLFRAVQAIGGGGLMPSAVGIVSDQYRERRAQAIGLFTSVFPIGGIIGPNLGGYILEHWTWRELFWINVPLGIAVFVGVYVLLKAQEVAHARPRFDLVGLALYASAVVSLMGAMTVAGEEPGAWSQPIVWVLLLASLVLGAFFVRHVRVAPEPVMDPVLLMKNPYLAANLYNFFFGAAAFGFFSFVPYYAVVRYGMTPFQSGAVLTPRAATMIVMSTIASLYVIRLGYRLPMLAGMFLVALTLVLLGQDWTAVKVGGAQLDGFWLLASVLAISGIGMGLANPASNNAALDLAPRQAAGLTGIRGMFRLTGGALSIASIVLALSFFPDKAHGMEVIFLVLAALLLVTVPLTLRIPDTARERWLRERREAAEIDGRLRAAAPDLAGAEPLLPDGDGTGSATPERTTTPG